MKTDKINFAKVSVSTLIIASLLVLFSCKDDEEEQVGPLVGTWTLTEYLYFNCDSPNENGTIPFNCAASVFQCIKVTFTKDNKFTYDVQDGGLILNGTYSTSGNQLNITISGDIDIWTFSVSGNTLTITYDDGDCDLTETYTKS